MPCNLFPPLISICHATARLHGWQNAWAAWQKNRSCPGEFYEYILCMDAKNKEYLPRFPFAYHRTIVNTGRESCTDAFNKAASISCGSIIFLASDDCFPPKDWDILLKQAVLKSGRSLDSDFVIRVSTGNPNDKGLILMPILSRARYLKYGYALYPEYPSVYADGDFTECALRDNAVIDATDLLFEHRHFSVGGMPFDEVYARQNSSQNYAIGEEILARRRQEGFARR